MDTPEYTTKACTKCGEIKPATLEHFSKCSKVRCGLAAWCKECEKQHRKDNREYIARQRRKHYEANRTQKSEYDHLRYLEKREENTQRALEYYRANRAHVKKRINKYKALNKDRVNEWQRQRYRRNPHKEAARRHIRRARKHALPYTFKPKHWLLCLGYWHISCAVCGGQLRDLFGDVEPHADHWIPLKHPDCPGTIPENMICLCSKCNLNKGAKPPDAWLLKRYGKSKANAILKRINEYFDWIKQQ